MEDTQAIPTVPPVAEPARPFWRRRRWPAWRRAAGGGHRTARGRRVVLLLGLTSIINVFDLAYTLLARDHEFFREMNPIGQAMLGHPTALIAFKTVPLVFAALIVLRARTRLLTEVLAWMICAVYAALACAWWRFYDMAR